MRLTFSYWLMVASFVGALLILLAQTYSHAPAEAQLWVGLVVWFIKVIPLLLIVRGLIQRRYTSAAWLSFLSMLYFIFAVLLVFTRGAELYGWLLSIDTLVLFLSTMLFARWKKSDL